ncbi:MAG: glutamate synthase central domain-containing protein, partial [Planctomycetota bacterium]
MEKLTVNNRSTARRGLYDPAYEHDACGIGAVVNVTGRRDHRIIEQGRQVLLNLQHRGAAGADETTGDGAGILFQLPHEFLAAEAEKLGIRLGEPESYALAMVFLPTDADLRTRCEDLLCSACRYYGLEPLGWRDVPFCDDTLGELARVAQPVVRQLFIDGSELSGEPLERKCMLARKRAERLAVEQFGSAGEDFYICSMSCRTVCYKGMFFAPQLFEYYADLSDKSVVTSLAIVHQRYSTNTFPNWRLAQPFRCVAHNGEINTLSGNLNSMRARERRLESELLGDDLSDLLPVARGGQSDSACFDNVLELLVRAGRSMPHSVMMMIPEAFGPSYHISADKRAFYEYHAALMEPWDGPAAMVFTDGRIVGGTLDRNGLRPARYVVTEDDLLVLASEVGVIDFPAEKIRTKGRLQPGRMLLVDTAEGRIVPDNEIKSRIARRRPYRRWLDENRIELRGLFSASRATPADAESIVRGMRSFGYTREELRGVLMPMAENGQEPIGSMGTDTPLAVLSNRPKLLFDYFKQRFAQVTNPPIDPLREGLVMSLMRFTGRRRNLLDETPQHCRQLKLPHPILTDEDLHRLRTAGREDFRVETVDSLFDADQADPGDALRRGLEELIDASAEAIENGASMVVLSDRGISDTRSAVPSLLATAAVHHGLLR